MVAKGIIPAGGFGTRFLPATKAMPKEMLPILDKPAVQYILEEGLLSHIKTFVVVTGKNKSAIEDYFDYSPELELFLKTKKKEDLLDGINKIIAQTQLIYLRQKEPLGLGHAIWSSKCIVGKEPVAIFLPDDIIISQTPCMAQLIQIAMQEKCNVVAVQEVPMDAVGSYGVISIKKQYSPNLFQIKEIIEKPKISDAPSNLAVVGRYVLSPSIFQALDDVKPGVGNEIQLTDGIQRLIFNGEKVFAYKIQGTRYDIGTPLGLLKANIELGLRNSKYAREVNEYLHDIDADMVMLEGRSMVKKTLITSI